jgi:hyaluronan synthase
LLDDYPDGFRMPTGGPSVDLRPSLSTDEPQLFVETKTGSHRQLSPQDTAIDVLPVERRLTELAPAPLSRQRRNLYAGLVFLLCCAALAGLGLVTPGPVVLTGYGACALAYLLVKLIGSIGYRESRGLADQTLEVAAVVPVYNEDPDAFRQCLGGLLRQTHPPSEIFVIDDGSDSDVCLRIAEELLVGVPGAYIHRFASNCGKREAQAWAFRRTTADLVLTVDSDTILADDCLANGLRPFEDQSVQAVTGTIRATNYRKNLLTRLIDLRYVNAFLYERAAYSRLGGSVLCCCGSMSIWRTQLLKDNLEDFVTQRFLGISVSYGDDRRLTNYALAAGRVVLQDNAVAYTLVPERMGHFLRQQIRWNKSFFRESLWLVRTFGPQRMCWWLGLAELVAWVGFSISLVAVLAVFPLLGVAHLSAQYLGYAAVMAYARSARHVGAPGGYRRGKELGVFLLAPVYAAIHLALLMPLRIYSLATLRDGSWGTRAKVEVAQ